MANSCSVSTHSAFVVISRPCDGAVIPIYQPPTELLPTVTIEIENIGDCPITLVVARQNSTTPIRIVVQPDTDFVVNVDLVTSISVQCNTSTEPENECNFSVGLDISSCICC
ncbi:hypothetical protein SAMN04487909_1345 [Aneurinibacillus migulanus]|uniref:Uncharacterized protein n=1 Tax=Aneurinibacillus migulanus TaxID=47500 RepID=A0A1G8XZL0_ANEMI|nr:hypothetical protein SAMN04487909_1345 [Aneurinibacillus migulanus]